MYFANDGGIYRVLDGYTGLLTGTCGGSNQFDSLNQKLGSITQFISFPQHPSDPNTLLGGAENNGSPATSTSQSNTNWVNVNAGDGGYNQINPDNPTEWFTANPDVSIERCTLGVDYRAQDFSSGLIVSNATVGGDSGPFFTPLILEPQNSAELIVGFNFVINNNSAAQTIKAGQTASYNLDVVPLGNGSVFPANVTLSCSTASLPLLTTCSFTPSLVAAGQGDTNVVLKLQTTAATSPVSRLAAPHLLWYDLGISLAGVLALGG